MRNLVNWKDHKVQYPNRFVKRAEGDYTFLEKAPGTIKEQGTPQNAANFNTMDLAAFEAMLMADEAVRIAKRHGDVLEGLTGEIISATLTNTLFYPFNNSSKTLQLSVPRNTKDYTVDVEVLSASGGAIGDFEIKDKLLNGFKIRYTGSATSVSVRCYVRGGI